MFIHVVRLFNLVISSSIRHQLVDCRLVLIDKKAYVTNVCHQYYISIYVYNMLYFPNFLYVLIKCNIRFGMSFSFIPKFSQFKRSMTFKIGSNLWFKPSSASHVRIEIYLVCTKSEIGLDGLLTKYRHEMDTCFISTYIKKSENTLLSNIASHYFIFSNIAIHIYDI